MGRTWEDDGDDDDDVQAIDRSIDCVSHLRQSIVHYDNDNNNNNNDNNIGGTYLGGGPAEGGELGLEGGGARRLIQLIDRWRQSIVRVQSIHYNNNIRGRT